MKRCIDCKIKITLGSKTGRCKSCAALKRVKRIGSPNYIDGRTLRKYNCITCGKQISYNSQRCKKCNYIRNRGNFSGNKNPRWKGGISKNNQHVKKILRKNFLKRYHNITPKEYAYLVKKQHGKCLICKTKQKTLFIDHNHKSNHIRGLLCLRCNSALGFIREDIKIAKRIIKYLEFYRED
jgi:hypothetical protein